MVKVEFWYDGKFGYENLKVTNRHESVEVAQGNVNYLMNTLGFIMEKLKERNNDISGAGKEDRPGTRKVQGLTDQQEEAVFK